MIYLIYDIESNSNKKGESNLKDLPYFYRGNKSLSMPDPRLRRGKGYLVVFSKN